MAVGQSQSARHLLTFFLCCLYRNAMIALFTFYSLAAMLARVLAMALCLSHVGVLSKGMNRLIWFFVCGLLSTIPVCVLRKIGYLQK